MTRLLYWATQTLNLFGLLFMGVAIIFLGVRTVMSPPGGNHEAQGGQPRDSEGSEEGESRGEGKGYRFGSSDY